MNIFLHTYNFLPEFFFLVSLFIVFYLESDLYSSYVYRCKNHRLQNLKETVNCYKFHYSCLTFPGWRYIKQHQ